VANLITRAPAAAPEQSLGHHVATCMAIVASWACAIANLRKGDARSVRAMADLSLNK
jgi:hypothetical protein